MSPRSENTSVVPLNRYVFLGLGLLGLLLIAISGDSPSRYFDIFTNPATSVMGCLYLAIALASLLSKSFASSFADRVQQFGTSLDLIPSAGWILLMGIGFSLAGSVSAGAGPNPGNILSLPLWFLGAALIFLSLRRQDSPPAQECYPAGDLVVLLILFLLAFMLRVVRLEQMPYVLSGDEGSVGLVGWEFIQGSRDNLLGLGWFSFPALYSWLLSLSQLVFGRTAVAIRLVSALAGALTIPGTYQAGRTLFNRSVGLLAAVWLAAFHYHVFFSRIAYNNVFDGLFLILCVTLLYQAWQSNQRTDFLLLGVLLGFSQYFYTTARAIPLILVLWLPWLRLRNARWKTYLPQLTSTLLVAGSISLPLIATYLSQPDTLIFTAGRVSLLDPTLLGPAARALGTSPLGLVLEQTLVTALGLTVGELQGIYLDSGQPMLLGLSTIIFALGLMLALIRWRKPNFAILLLTLLFSILIGGLSVEAPSSQRLILLPPILALIIAALLDSLRAWLDQHWPRLRLLFSILILSSMAWMVLENVNQLFRVYFPEEHYGSLNGEVTQEMIEMLQEETPEVLLYFIGGERMQYDSIPSITYLQPAYKAKSLNPVDQLSLPSAVQQRTLFIVLPEQASALTEIAATYPESTVIARYNRHGRILFYVRSVEPTT